MLEEYDGLNNVDADGILLVVTLPLLTRGHAIQCHVLDQEYIQVQVPNIYHLLLGLPLCVDQSKVQTFFDCKIRRLFVHAPKREVAPKPTEEYEEEPVLGEEEDLFNDVIEDVKKKVEVEEEEEEVLEIDTDKYFERGNTGKV